MKIVSKIITKTLAWMIMLAVFLGLLWLIKILVVALI